MTPALVAGEEWEALVDSAPTPDVYFRPGWCRAWESAGHGRAVAVRTEQGLFPLLLRDLPWGEGSDAITPYGYGGFLPLEHGADFAAEVRQLRDWCASESVASALLRLHPLVGGPGSGVAGMDEVEVREHGPTAAIELSRVENGRLTGMSKGRRADLSVARREVEIRWGGDDSLERFRAVYDETMRRLGASEYYRFPVEHYRVLAEGLGERLGVALALRGAEVVGGALFLADPAGPWAHYHLSGTTETGREHKAGTLLVHEGAIWAAERGCELLHLGGGTSGADSLYAFKRSFGSREQTYSFATVVADRERYDELVERRRAGPEPLREGFFPAYRA